MRIIGSKGDGANPPHPPPPLIKDDSAINDNTCRKFSQLQTLAPACKYLAEPDSGDGGRRRDGLIGRDEMLLSQCSQFLFALSAFRSEDVHECGNRAGSSSRSSGGGSEVASAPVSLPCSMQLSAEAQEANWNRCGINPSLGELC